MKTTVKKENVIAAILAILLVPLSVGTFYYLDESNSLKKELNGEKLKHEMVLSEKLNIEKLADKLKEDLVAMKGKNNSLSNMLESANASLSQKQKELDGVLRKLSGMKVLEKSLAEMKSIKSELENKVKMLDYSLNQVRNENDLLTRENEVLKNENEMLAQNISIMGEMLAGNFRIESQKKVSQKLTAKAKKTKKMVVSFDLPQDLVTNISFRVTTPDGQVVSSKEDGIAYVVVEKEGALYASIKSEDGEFSVVKRVEMTYKPNAKLSGGIYKIEVLNNNKKVGTSQVRLQ